MISNLKYMIKNWINWDKKSVLYFTLRVPSLVLQPIITAYIPKVMIDCILNDIEINRFIFIIGLLSIVLAIVIWLDPLLRELLNGSARIIRMRYAIMAFDKNLDADFAQIESLHGREMNNRASEFYKSYYAGSATFFETFNQTFVCIVGVIASIALIHNINFFIVILIFSTCIIEFLLLKFLNKKIAKAKDESYKIFTRFNYYYEQSKNLSSAKDIKLYGFADKFIAAMAHLLYQNERIVSLYCKQNIAISGTRALLNLIRELVASIYLVYLVLINSLSISDFIFCFGVITGFSNWILSLVHCYSALERCCGDCQKFRDFIENGNELKYYNQKNNTEKDVYSIEFKNVSFIYPGAEKETLRNISFTFTKGENIAIVGENGAGKTTVVKLLCGLYKPTNGCILLNGKSLDDYDLKTYFNYFSPVFQDHWFLPLTIAQNVAATNDYDKNRLYDALDKAGMLEKIEALENKEKTFMIKDVYKAAVDFSGGEKQRLLLAKAIYKDAPVLVLDEPTAALDPIAENELYIKYKDITQNKISFFISHRLSSTRFCDRIILISNGEIAESGTHQELMDRKGCYYRMYQMQSYYYREHEV